MAVADVRISGAYLISETAGIQAHLIKHTNPASGANVFMIPDAGNLKYHVGLIQTQ